MRKLLLTMMLAPALLVVSCSPSNNKASSTPKPAAARPAANQPVDAPPPANNQGNGDGGQGGAGAVANNTPLNAQEIEALTNLYRERNRLRTTFNNRVDELTVANNALRGAAADAAPGVLRPLQDAYNAAIVNRNAALTALTAFNNAANQGQRIAALAGRPGAAAVLEANAAVVVSDDANAALAVIPDERLAVVNP